MDIMLMITAVWLMNLGSFFLGAKVCKMGNRDEESKAPSVSPLKAFREREVRKQAEHEQSRLDAILRNVEGYNGTANGQEDIPGR